MTQAPGNTRSRCWFFTYNNYQDDTDDTIISKIGEAEYCIGREVGEQGTPHLQGCIKFKNARTFKSMRKLLDNNHVEMCRNWEDCLVYCSKEGNYKTNVEFTPKIDPMAGKVWKDWQKKIIDGLKEKPDDRTISWYWEPTGGVGKTTLAKHICMYNKGAIYVSGSAKDVKCGIVLSKIKPRIVIWDVCRSQSVDYQGIEEVKNGIFFSTKYEPGMMMFNPPHIIIFANFEPIYTALSHDRYRVFDISESAISI